MVIGVPTYLTPTLQILCGVVILGQPLPPERLAGVILVWLAPIVLTIDALRSTSGAVRRRQDRQVAADQPAMLGAEGIV